MHTSTPQLTHDSTAVLNLQRHDILMREDQFDKLLGTIGCLDAENVRYQEFLAHFKKQLIQTTKSNMLGTVSGISVDSAVTMIRDKIQRRLKGGPAGLRRAWKDLSAGARSVSHVEFQRAVAAKLMISLDKELLQKVSSRFDPSGSGFITYQSFCELVMGNKADDSTSIASKTLERPAHSERDFEASIRREIMENWKDLRNKFSHLGRGSGLSYGQIRKTLEQV